MIHFVQESLWRASKQLGSQLRHRLLRFLAQRFNPLLQQGIGLILLAGLQLAEHNVLKLSVQRRPLPFINGNQHELNHRDVFFQRARIRLRASGRHGQYLSLAQQLRSSLQRQLRITQNAADPNALLQILNTRSSKYTRRLLQPIVRPGMASREIVQSLDKREYGIVAAFPAKPIN
ncbi:hypothetical protein D3C77_340500 [compost metagenome]